MTQIVTINVTQVQAPTPSTLQKTGAFVSQGATILSPGASSILTVLSDLTPLLVEAANITSLSWSAETVIATTAAPHGLPNGETIDLAIVGAVPIAYSGTFPCLITGASTFTYTLLADPGSETSPGAWLPAAVNDLTAMATDFFSQGAQQAVYALEVGSVDDDDAIAFLNEYLVENPNSEYTPGSTGYFYSYLVPRSWAGHANFLALLDAHEGLTDRTYFFVTTNLQDYTKLTALQKDVIALVEAPVRGTWPQNTITAASWTSNVVSFTTQTAHGVEPGQWFQILGMSPAGYNGYYLADVNTAGSSLTASLTVNPGAETAFGHLVASKYASPGVPASQFTLAAAFWRSLVYDPSSSNKVAPYAFSELVDVTPYPKPGNSAILTTLTTASINYIGTGAEGGISNTVLFWGTTKDARDFTYWYSVDWVSINLDIALSNTIINGSNDPINPLYYNQSGIDRLQDSAASVFTQAVSFGLANGIVKKTALPADQFLAALDAGTYDGYIVINAEPFLDYLAANPNDYKIGRYAGLSGVYVPNRGFISILFSLNVTDFVVI